MSAVAFADLAGADLVLEQVYLGGSTGRIGDGRWFYSTDLVVDRLVDPHEAWQSGARSWTERRWTEFGSDLAYPGTLQSTVESTDAAKGTADPAQWLPADRGARCRYAVSSVATKWRWGLSVDPAERVRLARLLAGPCGQRLVDVAKA